MGYLEEPQWPLVCPLPKPCKPLVALWQTYIWLSLVSLQVIVSTNRGEPLVLQKKLTLSGIAFENSSRRLIGKQDYFVDLNNPNKGIFQKLTELFQ